jgi:hypothetical protein
MRCGKKYENSIEMEKEEMLSLIQYNTQIFQTS